MTAVSGLSLYFFLIVFQLYIAIAVISIIALWKVFRKAGWPGWAAIIPFYSNYVTFRVAKMWGGWMFLQLALLISSYIFTLFLPWHAKYLGETIVDCAIALCMIISVIANFRISRAFGKSVGFGIGMMFLPFVFLPILAFSKAEYQFDEDDYYE